MPPPRRSAGPGSMKGHATHAKAKVITGGALPAPGSMAQMLGRAFSNPVVPQGGLAGRLAQASTASARTFNTMLGPVSAQTHAASLRRNTQPPVKPAPVDTSRPAASIQPYSHPMARVRPAPSAASPAGQRSTKGRSGALRRPY